MWNKGGGEEGRGGKKKKQRKSKWVGYWPLFSLWLV